jgi:hypothetical protein
MNGQPIAIQMAAQSTQRHISEPARERTPRPRRATARLLQAVAVRLDPAVVQEPQLS